MGGRADGGAGGRPGGFGGFTVAGSAGRSFGGRGGAGGTDACDVGCTAESSGQFCNSSEVSWVCRNGYQRELFEANCDAAATGAVRYCCPESFLKECQ